MPAAVAIPAADRHQSLGEEIANSISHGVALLGALAAAPILIVAAAHTGKSLTVVSFSIFGISIVLLYASSMVYHFLPGGRAKDLFRVLDHVAIFLLIAGTYTPFALVALGGTEGWTLFGMNWGAAAIGIITQVVPRLRHPVLSVTLYLLMGWMVLLFIRPLCVQLPVDGMLWLIAGGLAYTLGVIFYVADAKYSHFVWHLFTMAGTTCHVLAVLWYVA